MVCVVTLAFLLTFHVLGAPVIITGVFIQCKVLSRETILSAYTQASAHASIMIDYNKQGLEVEEDSSVEQKTMYNFMEKEIYPTTR